MKGAILPLELYGQKTKIVILIICLFLTSGFTRSKKNDVPALTDASNQIDYDKKYQSYGAYFDK